MVFMVLFFVTKPNEHCYISTPARYPCYNTGGNSIQYSYMHTNILQPIEKYKRFTLIQFNNNYSFKLIRIKRELALIS